MHLLSIFRISLLAISRATLRSVLAALGVVIGVASVVAMVSLGNGAKADVESTFAKLDTNLLSINSRMPFKRTSDGRPVKMPAGEGISISDYRAIRGEIHSVALASVHMSAPPVQVKANGRASDAMVTGIDVNGLQLDSRKVIRGAMFGRADVNAAAAVCLTTEFVAQSLFAGENPIGRIVRIRDLPFTVVGLVSDQISSAPDASSQFNDTRIYVPYTSLQRRLSRQATVGIVMRADDPWNLAGVQQRVVDLLEQRRGGRRAEFVTNNVAESVEAYKEGSRTMALLLGAIGSISLVVGGIGIMNIMLVSVTERTREIGIRVAIGTRRRDVLRQFLIESMVLGILGGVIGIVLGVGVAYVFTQLNEWRTVVDLRTVLMAFFISASLGVLFGYFPARRAAALEPILALRSD